MRFLKYVLRNVTRNKLRSTLTAFSICICLAMLTMMYGFATLNDQLVQELAKANRMIVMSRDGFTSDIPISILGHVRGLDGVKAVVPLAWSMGIYKDEKMPTFAQLATDADQLLNVWFEFKLSPDQLAKWKATRNGCIVDRGNFERRGWKIGEHIPLKGNNYSVDLDLVLCGVYDGPEFINDLYFHYDYLNELLRNKRDPKADRTIILFFRADSAEAIDQLVVKIDERIQNSLGITYYQKGRVAEGEVTMGADQTERRRGGEGSRNQRGGPAGWLRLAKRIQETPCRQRTPDPEGPMHRARAEVSAEWPRRRGALFVRLRLVIPIDAGWSPIGYFPWISIGRSWVLGTGGLRLSLFEEGEGSIRFTEEPDGTRVQIRLSYNPPGGAIRHW